MKHKTKKAAKKKGMKMAGAGYGTKAPRTPSPFRKKTKKA